MNAIRRLGYSFILSPLVFLLVIVMLLLVTSTVPAAQLPTTESHPEVYGDSWKIDNQPETGLTADDLAPRSSNVELKLDHLPATMMGERKVTISGMMAAQVQMVLDDGQLETAYGMNSYMWEIIFIITSRELIKARLPTLAGAIM